jgi:hypothetical protein
VLSTSGCLPSKPSPLIVVQDSRQVFLGEPNEPVTAPWPYVLVSRGHYQYLKRCEATVRSHPEWQESRP